MTAPDPIRIPTRQIIRFITTVNKTDSSIQQALDGRILNVHEWQQLRDEHVRALVAQHPLLAEALDEEFVSNPGKFQPWCSHTVLTFHTLPISQIDPERPREFQVVRALATHVAAPGSINNFGLPSRTPLDPIRPEH